MQRPKLIKNWGKTFECAPNIIYYPKSETEIISAIQQCTKNGNQLRPMGSLYSYTPLICSEAMLSLDNFTGVEEINYEDMTVTVRGGTKISHLEQFLFANNLALYNLGDINQQTIAGLIATASHGTGLSFGIASTQIASIQMITANGEVLECSETKNSQIFKAAQVSLGTLGVVTKVKLKVLPKYYVLQERYLLDFDIALSKLLDSFANNRNYEFFWFPYTDFIFEKKQNFTTEVSSTKKFTKIFNDYILENGALWMLCEVARNAPDFYRKHANTILRKLNLSIKHTLSNLECYATQRLVNHREIEYSIPINEALITIQEIRDLLNHHKYPLAFPIEVRCVAADDIYLSPNYQQQTVWIAVHAYTKDPYVDLFKAAEAIFIKHHGRPHWGKLHWLENADIKKLYPCLPEFNLIRQRLDPHGLFLNSYVRTLLG